MELKKMNLKDIQGALSREDMKKIMAGSGGNCGGHYDYCNSINHINCCTGYVCAENLCQTPTVAVRK